MASRLETSVDVAYDGIPFVVYVSYTSSKTKEKMRLEGIFIETQNAGVVDVTKVLSIASEENIFEIAKDLVHQSLNA